MRKMTLYYHMMFHNNRGNNAPNMEMILSCGLEFGDAVDSLSMSDIRNKTQR